MSAHETRYDLKGKEIESPILTVACHECGMQLTSYREFHPYEACVIFQRTRDSSEVWEALAARLRLSAALA